MSMFDQLEAAGLPACSIDDFQARCQSGEFSVAQAEQWCDLWNQCRAHGSLRVQVHTYVDGSFDTIGLVNVDRNPVSKDDWDIRVR